MTATQEVKVTFADPSALGLFGLAMVTFVASSQKLGWTTGLSLVLPWAIFLGSFAQLFAAIGDAKRNNVFGATAFGAFSFFWLAVGFSWLAKMGVLGTIMQTQVDVRQLGMGFLGYLIFSLYMTVGALITNKVLFLIFVFIDFLFIGLAMYSFEIMPEFSSQFAGWSEFIIALLSFYASAGAVLNVHFGKVIIPIGKPFLKK